jgi:uncharacterized MAPEG superfamily protein
MLYLVTIAPAKALGHREFDNAAPRAAAFYEHPVRGRALGAHVNGIEAFPFFATAVLLAEFRHADQLAIDVLALAFVAVRCLFVLAYIGNKPTLRTMLWNAAFGFNIGIFLLPRFGVQGAIVGTAVALSWSIAVGLLLAAMARPAATANSPPPGACSP